MIPFCLRKLRKRRAPKTIKRISRHRKKDLKIVETIAPKGVCQKTNAMRTVETKLRGAALTRGCFKINKVNSSSIGKKATKNIRSHLIVSLP